MRPDFRALFRALFLALWVPALAVAEPFSLEHLTQLRRTGNAVISPDGTRIAYLLHVPRQPNVDDDGKPWTELHVVDVKTGASRGFVTGEVNLGALDWTPDGKGISFLSKRGKDEHKTLWRIPVDGGEAQRIVAHEGADISSYSWNGDGRRVAYLATEKKSKKETELEKKGFNQQVFEEDWRPVKVWVAALENAPTKAASGKALDLPGSAFAAVWERTGNRLAVSLGPTPSVDDEMMLQRLHVVDATGGKVVARIENPGKLGSFHWSPDGVHLAYLAAADVNDPIPGRLMVVDARGGTPRDVVPGFLGDVSSVEWKDARTLLFTAIESVTTTLNQVAADGTGRKVLVPGGKENLFDLDLTPDGKTAAFLGVSSRHPPEVFHWGGSAANRPRRLTDSNPWLAKVDFATQEVVKWKARDGLDLEGVLVRPLAEKKGERHPLIVVVHGGPEGFRLDDWVTDYGQPGQLAAARGFAVFYPNYRASGGRGVAFSKLDHGDPAGKEFDDIVDGVDHLVASGLVDTAKVGITGGSYGGYASAWGATFYSERFAAAAAFVGISNLLSFAGTTEIPNEMHLVHWRKRPFEDWKLALERSPIYHAKKSRTPTLILHGTADTRVPTSQSYELYRFLKLSGNPAVRLVLYPGEGHGNADAASRLDYAMRVLQWFEHYLKGPGGEPPRHVLDYPANPNKKEGSDD